MAYTFNIKKTSGDVSVKDFKIEWDPNARVIKATVWLRGDDYDRDDANVPYMVLKEPFGTERKRAYLNDISNTKYQEYVLTWDPAEAYGLADLGNKTPWVYVFDENDTNCGYVTKQLAIDLSPENELISPLADGVQGDGGYSGTVDVIFKPKGEYPAQNFKPQIKWSVNEDMSSPTTLDITKYMINGVVDTYDGTTNWVAYSAGTGVFDISHAKMKDCTCAWTNEAYMAGIQKYLGAIDVSSLSTGTQVYVEIDYRATIVT
tara:strand:+ start:51 stop:833 length:783 start_codon:yes stop_codon:yes gene_type:complete